VVKKGQVLATASGNELDTALAQAANDWRVAKLQLTSAKETLSDAEDNGDTDQIRQARGVRDDGKFLLDCRASPGDWTSL